QPTAALQASSGAVRAIRFNPQEFLLAVATSDRTVKLYDIEFMELFCVTAPDTCPTRAITFDPDGQKMYCASPSGLRRWSWDNDTASARLEAMGDVPWGKVGAGALHYNADGQQLLAASCAGSRVSVWAVDFDSRDVVQSRSQQHQQQQQTGDTFGSATAASAAEAASEASAPLGTPARGATTTATESPSDPSMSTADREYDDADAKVRERQSRPSRGNTFPVSRDGQRSHSRDSKPTMEKEASGGGDDGSSGGGRAGNAGNAGMPAFQVLGRQVVLLPTAAEEKVSSSSSSSSPPGVPAVTPAANPSGATAVGGPASAGGGMLQNRHAARAEAVAATVAAVASAKAATDDAVASVAGSVRHRSIGTSISDTLVIADGGAVDQAGDRAGGREHRPAAWSEPAPGKDDGGKYGRDRGRGVAAALGVVAAGDRHRPGGERRATGGAGDDDECKWHKRVAGAFAGVEGTAGDEKGVERRGDSGGDGGGGKTRGNATADEKGERREGDGTDRAANAAASSGVTPRFTVDPWPKDSRVEEAGGRIRAGVPGGGEDSPPLLGSPEPAPTAASNPARSKNEPPSFPSSSRRSPDRPQPRDKTDAVVTRSSAVGFPITAADGSSSGGGGSSKSPPAPSGGLPPEARRAGDVSVAAAAAAPGPEPEGLSVADIFGDGGGGDCGGGGGGDELGMTRPRTATRRWDRPGPPGDDEVIAKTLLSRATATSTLSNRLTHLRMLRYGWADGDVSGTISKLTRLERSATVADDSPRTVVADFLWVVPLDGARVTLDHCLELMPLLEGLWKLDADSCVAAATRCLESIVRRFGGFIRDTLAAPVAAGRVDLAREDRIARCREAHRAFIRGYHHLERSEGEFYEDRRIAAVAERLRPLFESYFMS
ncbi:unnamed protein product, partial [Ectocarpus fasciculatus]